MSELESTYRVKRQKRVVGKRSEAFTPKGSKPNQFGFVITLP